MKHTLLILLFLMQTVAGYTVRFVDHKDGDHVLLQPFLQELQQIFNRSVFVETGTYCGGTTQIAAQLFSQVYSVEISDTLYENVCKKLAHLPTVHLFHDHSVNFLKRLCTWYTTLHEGALFWFDAHESGGFTTHYEDILTPIIDELRVLHHYGMHNGVILIDDIRCFGSTYEQRTLLAHNGYPTLQEICALLQCINPHYACVLSGDILIAYDAQKYTVAVSPVTHACTISRLYDGGDDLSDDIIRQEAGIADADPDERQYIDQLYQWALNKQDDFHAFLWYGLSIAKTDPAFAHEAFLHVIEKGYTQWRIYWYLANSSFVLGNYGQALDEIQQVITRNRTYMPAQQLYHQIHEALSLAKDDV